MPETVIYNKRKLCYIDILDFTDIQGIGHDPLYKRYNSVANIVKSYIKPEYQGFLAQPVARDGDLDYYIEEWQDTPVSLDSLQGPEHDRYAAIKEQTVKHYKEVCENLPIDQLEILAKAIRYVNDERFIFCYDGKVAIVAWGMRPDNNKRPVGGWIKREEHTQKCYVTFDAGKHGRLEDPTLRMVSRQGGSVLVPRDIPVVIADEGYAFTGWDPNPQGYTVNGEVTFTAQYTMLQPAVVPPMPPEPPQPPQPEPDPVPAPPPMGRCTFNPGPYGTLQGYPVIEKPVGTPIFPGDIPRIVPHKGYIFKGWDFNPVNAVMQPEMVFNAVYEKKVPWYVSLKWLWWLLLALLLLLLAGLLFKGCAGAGCSRLPILGGDRDLIEDDDVVVPIERIVGDDGRERDDNGVIRDIRDPEGRLPEEGFVPPVRDERGQEPPIVEHEGAPDVIANRLNIFFEDTNADMNQWVRDFKNAYPGSQYMVIGSDPNVMLIQIQVPESERDRIRDELPGKLPQHKFFVLDESIMELMSAPSDSDDPSQYGWHIRASHADRAWEDTKGSNDVVVAIVDDGFEVDHPMIANRFYKAYNVFRQDRKLSVGSGHGTHVAALAAGTIDNLSKGAAGVAPNVRIMPIQVFDNGVCTFSSLASGIMYAIHNGADVVNISIGPQFPGLDQLPVSEQIEIAKTYFKNEEAVFKHIIKAAEEHNCILVFAAGNDNITTAILPECRSTSYTLNVAAVDPELKPTMFTNYAFGTNISAPGQNIYSAWPGKKLKSLDGTSMAAPIVSGAVALLRSVKPDLTAKQAIGVMQQTGVPTYNNNQFVPPMLQIDKALAAVRAGDIPDGPVFKMGQGGEGSNPSAPSPNPGSGGNGSGGGGPGGTPPNDPGFDNGSGSRPVNGGGDDYDDLRKRLEELIRQRDALNRQIDEISKRVK